MSNTNASASKIAAIAATVAEVWEHMCGVIDDVKYYGPKVKNGIVVLTVMLLTFMVFSTITIFVGIAGQFSALVFFSFLSIIACILIGNYGTTFLAGIINASGELVKNDSQTKKIAETIKKIFSPLKKFAAILAFVNAWIALNGFSAFTSLFFYVAIALIVALVLLLKPTKIPYYIMVSSLILSAVHFYAKKCDDPVACMLNSKFETVSFWMNNHSLSGESNSTELCGIAKSNIHSFFDATVDSRTNEIVGLTRVADSLLVGEACQVLNAHPKKWMNLKLIKIMLKDEVGQFATGRILWIQPNQLEIGNNIENGDGYSIVKTGGKFLGIGKPEVWTVYVQTNQPFTITNIPTRLCVKSGVPIGSLLIDKPESTDGILDTSAINVACLNPIPTRTFQCQKGLKFTMTFM